MIRHNSAEQKPLFPKIIVYSSNTGYSEQYAKMISRALNVPAYRLGEVPACHEDAYALYVGWLFAGRVVGYKKAEKHYNVFVIVAVGMSPPSPEIVEGIRKAEDVALEMRICYLQGGFDINRLSLPLKLIMKIKCKQIAARLRAKGELTEAEQLTLEMTQHPTSAVREENIQQVIDLYKD